MEYWVHNKAHRIPGIEGGAWVLGDSLNRCRDRESCIHEECNPPHSVRRTHGRHGDGELV